MSFIDRREVLTLGAAAALSLSLPAVPALAANNAAELIRKFTGGQTPVAGKVKLDLPEIAENGNSVPLRIAVDSPMTPESYVSEILVVADGNPAGGVATFRFQPGGVAEANIRIRLMASQNVTAVAKMSDGTFASGTKAVNVTIGGCSG